MPVPKKRRSKSKKRMKAARWKITPPNLRPCPDCGAKGLSHFACASCGYYKGKPVFVPKAEKITRTGTED